MLEALKKYWEIIEDIYYLYDHDLAFKLCCKVPRKYIGRMYCLTEILKRHGISIDEVVTAMEEVWPQSKCQIDKDKNGNLEVIGGDWNISHLIVCLAKILAIKAKKEQEEREIASMPKFWQKLLRD